MAHGYLEDGYGTHGEIDPDGSDERDRRWRDRDHRGHGWRSGGDWRDRDPDRAMMFEEGGRSWSDEDRWSDREWSRDQGGFGGFRGYSEGRRGFSANPDDHYRSWRDRHMSELDREYADYCREREQQFHSDFDAWRRQRHASYQPLRTGMTNSGLSHDPSGEVQQTTEATPPESDGTGAATLGTNSAPESGSGRGRR